MALCLARPPLGGRISRRLRVSLCPSRLHLALVGKVGVNKSPLPIKMRGTKPANITAQRTREQRGRAAELLNEKEWRLCAADPVYFIEHHWHIQTVLKGAIIPELREPQRETLRSLLADENVVILKARQIGYTTICAAYSFWLAFFHPDKVIIFLSKGEREAKVIMRMAKYGYRRMPAWLKDRGPKPTADNQTEWPWDNGSSIESLPSKQDPARGRTVNLVIVDEWAFLDDPENAWASIEPIADLGGKIVGLSTANGSGNFFHKLYSEAVARINGFRALFYGWDSVPERDEAWYETKKRSMPAWQLAQEYPANAEEAFIKSGNPVFDIDLLRALHKQRPRDGYVWRNPNHPKLVEFRPQRGGALSVYHHPEPTCSYVIGADVAEGLDYGDFSSAHVINVQSGAVAAVWHGHIAPDLFGDVLHDLGWMFGRALIGCEVNNHGLTTCTALKNLNYPNIYYRFTYDERTKKRGKKIGWLTTKITRPLMVDELASELRSETLGLADEGTIGELITFVRDEKGYMHGSPHDDRVFSLGIANQMRKHAHSPEYRAATNEIVYGTWDWWMMQVEPEKVAERVGMHNVRASH